ncbi:uncharacterized protein EDB93DRAFT_850400 [Suillus bovinus]|uniref:uncharacterized protein n=1 Tax=Suillus bovinus TaxID=48563 RepID=UPI001B86F43A|nr:uncharacterized protein EDB93DRAFT_850400 [Suillus bovinus]KAG2134186.1 hypothetical protein EDB93DRAFT_850400 [Suillus bovinus]
MRLFSAIVLVVVAALASSISATPFDEESCPWGSCETTADCICPWLRCASITSFPVFNRMIHLHDSTGNHAKSKDMISSRASHDFRIRRNISGMYCASECYEALRSKLCFPDKVVLVIRRCEDLYSSHPRDTNTSFY